MTLAQPIITDMVVVDDLALKVITSLSTGTTADTDEVRNGPLDVEGASIFNSVSLLLDDASSDSTATKLSWKSVVSC